MPFCTIYVLCLYVSVKNVDIHKERNAININSNYSATCFRKNNHEETFLLIQFFAFVEN